MQLVVLAYLAVLFVLLTPGVLLRFPKGCSKLVVAATHGLILAIVWHFTHRFVRRLEGFQVVDPATAKNMVFKADSTMPVTPQPAPTAATPPPATTIMNTCMKKEECKAGESCLNGVCVQF